MRPAAEANRTKTLQVCGLRDVMFVGFCTSFLVEGACYTGTKASMTWKGTSTKWPKCGVAELGVSKLGRSVHTMPVPAFSLYLCWGVMVLASSFIPGGIFLWTLSLQDMLRWVNNSHSCMFQDFFKLLDLSCICTGYCAASLRIGTQLPNALQALPEPSVLIFKILGFRSWWL